MMIRYSLLPTSRTSLQFNIHAAQMLPADDAATKLLSGGLSLNEICFFLESQMDISKMKPATEVLQ